MVFGAPLAQAVLPKHGLPIVVLHTLNWLNTYEYPTKNAGIFLSKEGKADAQKQALEEAELQRLLKVYENFFNEDDQSPLTPSTPSAVVGGILMKYLESLPDPIIPREYYHTYTRVIQIGSREQRLIQLRILFKTLPSESMSILIYLCTYLHGCCLDITSLAHRFHSIFMQPPSPTNTTTTTTTNITETVWEIEVARTLIEETDFLQGAAAHLSRSTDDPKYRRATPLASEPFTLLAEALYDLESTDNNRWVPGFKAGEVFELFDIKTDESGWLLGASAGSSGGREGFIPASYVSVIPEPARCVSWVDRLPLDEALRIGKTLEARKIHAMEILTTERTYVENLKVLNNLLTTLKDDNMGLTTSEIMTIFPSIETLKTCHEKLLAALEACLRDWNDNSMMGKIFIDNIKFIKLYRHYINGYKNANETVVRCRAQCKDFKKYIESIENTPAMLGNNLFDILITPVQRIPRYVLLLKDMIKSTPSTHPDKQYIEEAYTLVKEIADYVNSMKKLADNVVELQQLQQKFSGYPGKLDSLSTRKFIKDVVLTIDKEKVRMWLFDDIAIVTKPEAKRGDVYKYRYSFDLQTSKLALDTDTYTCKLFTSDSPSVRVIQYDGPKECADSFAEINGIIEKASECLIQGACGENQLALHSDGSQAYNESVNLKLLENRRAAFERLCASDNAYTNQLKTCVNSIIKPVQESGVIDSTTFCTIFSNFEMLCEKATAINFDLNTRLKEWNTNNNTADIFMSHEAELRFYTHYASHYNEQLSALDKAEENKDFVNYLHKCELVAGCSLRSVFELPMRKLSEYQITLQEMHINSKNHVEYEDLGAALKKLKLMNENIFLKGNESKIEKSTRRK